MELDRIKIAEQYTNGASIRALVSEYGVSYSTINRVLHKQGVDLRKQGAYSKRDKETTTATIQKAIDLYVKTNAKVTVIAKTAGIAPSTLYDHLRRQRITLRKNNKGRN